MATKRKSRRNIITLVKKRRTNQRRKYKRYTEIIPRTKTVKLRYVDIIRLDAAVDSLSTAVYSANSVFSPLASGAAHQPLSFDEWTTFYDHYNVLGSKCTAQFTSTGTVDLEDTNIVGIMLKDNTAISAVKTTLLEQPKASAKILTQSNAAQRRTVYKSYSARKFFNLKDVEDNRTVVGASVSSNPNEQAYYHIFCTSADAQVAITNPGPVNVMVTIDYIVNFSERKTLLGS